MYLYILIVYIASLFNGKAKKLVRGQRETWRALGQSMVRVKKNGPDGEDGVSKDAGEKGDAKGGPDVRGCVWVHAASVGEFEQARPIIERLRKEQPWRKIVVTFFSPSGYEMRKDYPLVDKVLYLPFATRRNAKRFVAALEPSMAIFVKYEFWPAYLKTLKKNGIPTYLIAGIFRKEQLFFKWYGGWYRRLLTCFTTLFVQDEGSKMLLEGSTSQRVNESTGQRDNESTSQRVNEFVVVAGDTRFDRVSAIASQEKEIAQVMRFVEGDVYLSGLQGTSFASGANGESKVIVAGSTWPEDEVLLAKYVEEHPGVKLVLTPHEIDAEHMHFIFNLFKGRFVRFSEATLMNVNTNDVLLIDKMGMLSTLYRFGQVAYVGGGFGAGIHNTIEAAVYGVPVVFGPKYHKFREAEELIAVGGGFSVTNYASLESALDEALAHHEEYGKKAADYVRSELGATDRIYRALFGG